MNLGELTEHEIAACLRGGGLFVRFGPFAVRIRSRFALAPLVKILYHYYPVESPTSFQDFDVEIQPSHPLRFMRRQARFMVDGRAPFWPMPASHAFAALEWGLNWCVATRSHQFLMLHSAVVERNGHAILFPAWPGSGKSTLCTALIHSGWRLLSDEFGLVCPEDSSLVPLPRPIPLKNESIDVIRRFSPEAVIGPSFFGTRKGTVAHVCPPLDSVQRAQEPARSRWLVFPSWMANSPLVLEPMDKGRAFLMVATNAFNYEVLGEMAFRAAAAIVDQCDCYSLTYSELDEAVTALGRLSSAANA